MKESELNRQTCKNSSFETIVGTLSLGIEADAGDVDAFHISICPVNRELPWGMNVEGGAAVLLEGMPSTALANQVFYCRKIEKDR